jgi:aryl-alcohol dehydrogenase-like predicted oxidoreductase
MITRKIASLPVSVVGLGCNNFGPRLDAARTAEVVDAAIDAGINFFDTATLYGSGKSEEFLGRAVKSRRSEVIIATKFGYPGEAPGADGSPSYIRNAAEASLKRLGTDYIDLYFLHRPDPKTPIADTLAALDELVKAGKVREIGCSDFTVEQIAEAEDASRAGNLARFVSVQNEFSLFHRAPENGVLQECEKRGLAFLPYFPLANGLLTGKYRKGKPWPKGTRISEQKKKADEVTDAKLDVVEKLAQFSESRGHSMLELAFSWLLAHKPVASVIAGATSPDQVRANAAAAAWELSANDLHEIQNLIGDR